MGVLILCACFLVGLFAQSRFDFADCKLPVKNLKDSNGFYKPAFTSCKEFGECLPESFELKDTLGKGNFGLVKRAVHTATSTDVAIKFQQHLSSDWYLFNRNEECIGHELSESDFPFIVKHYCTIMLTNGTVGYVMEIVDGPNLDGVVKETYPLRSRNELDLQKIMAQLAVSLEYIHGKGIVLADLKPGNILLTKDSDIKIHDFGLATKTFKDGIVLKKSEWVSYRTLPEYGNRPNVDWYAYGLFLFEILNGEGLYAQLEGPNAYKSPLIRGGFCPTHFKAIECDFIKQFSRVDWKDIWGLTKESRAELRKHAFFKGFDWSNLDKELSKTL